MLKATDSFIFVDCIFKLTLAGCAHSWCYVGKNGIEVRRFGASINPPQVLYLEIKSSHEEVQKLKKFYFFKFYSNSKQKKQKNPNA